MSKEAATFDEAAEACKKQCFDILVENLVVGEKDAEQKFATCCDDCRKAREIAARHTRD